MNNGTDAPGKVAAPDDAAARAQALLDDPFLPVARLHDLLNYTPVTPAPLPAAPAWVPSRVELDARADRRRRRGVRVDGLNQDEGAIGAELQNARAALCATQSAEKAAVAEVARITGMADPVPSAETALARAHDDAEAADRELSTALSPAKSVAALAKRVAELVEAFRAARDALARAELATSRVHDAAAARTAASARLDEARAEAAAMPGRRSAAEGALADARQRRAACEGAVATLEARLASVRGERDGLLREEG